MPFLPVLWWCFQGPGASSTDDCAPWQAASAVQRNFTVERRKGSYSAGEMGITSASSALSVLIKSRRIWKVLLATSPPVAEPHFFWGGQCATLGASPTRIPTPFDISWLEIGYVSTWLEKDIKHLWKSVCCQELLPPLRGVGSVAQEVKISLLWWIPSIEWRGVLCFMWC